MILECYGDEIVMLADLAGRFDAADKDSTEGWWLDQWSRVARRLGWSQSLDAKVSLAKQTGGGFIGVRNAPLAAFREWHKDRPPVMVGPWDSTTLSRVRHECVQTIRNTPNVWMAETPAYALPFRACANKQRAFAATESPSYFRRGEGVTPRGPDCEWEGAVRISFGTWPYVTGRLGRVADGLTWLSSDEWTPAVLAMQTCSELWEPAGNANQDARLVVQHWAEFRSATAALIDAMPEEPRRAGDPYRLGYRVAVHLGSEDATVLVGPRGPLSVGAYNYVVERFAAFFACRRSILESFTALPANVQQLLRSNPDPCLEPFLAPVPPKQPKQPQPPVPPKPKTPNVGLTLGS